MRYTDDELWMDQTLLLVGEAEREGEVPVAALVVCGGEIVGRGWNRNIVAHDPSAHAEIQAMRDAGRVLRNYRLNDCDLYCTLEPCLMCVGAIVHARIRRLVFAAADPRAGACGSVFDVMNDPRHNHQVEVLAGIRSGPAGDLLRGFFRQRRARRNLRP